MPRKSSLCSLAMATALAATAFTAPVVAQEPTSLRFFTIFDAGQVEQWEPIIAAFEEANPDIEVELETVAGSGAALYPDVLRTSMASGDPADVFFMWGGELAGPFIRGGQARPLDAYYEEHGWDDRFPGWVKGLLQRDGETFGVSAGVRGMGFWYRTDIFEEHGIAEPETYAELEEVCATLKEEDVYCATFGGKFGWHTMRLLDFFIETTCGPEIHDRLFALEATFDQPCVAEGYALLKKWVDEEWLMPDFLNVSPNDSRMPMFLGDAAMIIEGGWFERVLKANEQEIGLYDFFLPPTGHDPQRYPAFPHQWMVSAASEHPDEAARFIDFITAADTQRQFLETFVQEGSPTIGVEPDCETSPHTCKWVEIISSDRLTYALSDQAYTKELADDFFEVQDGVVAGLYTPEEAAAEMQRRAEAWTAQNPG